jgi:predicted RNA-binding Zn-ribbon protein involved in translation (DUF1610 family)
MLGHHHHPDKRELIPRTNLHEYFKKQIACANGAEKRKAPITAASDEVQVAMSVAALKTCRHAMKTSKPPPLPTSKGWGTHVTSNAIGSEFIEWYHPLRGKVNCGKYANEGFGSGRPEILYKELLQEPPLEQILMGRLREQSRPATRLDQRPSTRQLTMTVYDRSCRSCRKVISPAQIPIWEGKGFPCPACGRTLKTRMLPIKFTFPITFTLAITLCLGLGLRGPIAVLISLVASVPLYFIVYAAVGLAFPPELELISSDEEHPTD